MPLCVKPKIIIYCLCQITLNQTLSREFEKQCKFSSHVKAKSCKKKSHTKCTTSNCVDHKIKYHSMADVALPSNTASRQQTKICAASNKMNADQSSHMYHTGYNRWKQLSGQKVQNYFLKYVSEWTASVVQWSEFLATDTEVSGSIPEATRFSEQQWVWNGVHSAS